MPQAGTRGAAQANKARPLGNTRPPARRAPARSSPPRPAEYPAAADGALACTSTAFSSASGVLTWSPKAQRRRAHQHIASGQQLPGRRWAAHLGGRRHGIRRPGAWIGRAPAGARRPRAIPRLRWAHGRSRSAWRQTSGSHGPDSGEHRRAAQRAVGVGLVADIAQAARGGRQAGVVGQ